jgi:hypothetical protein
VLAVRAQAMLSSLVRVKAVSPGESPSGGSPRMALVSPHTRGVSILSAVSAASGGVDVVSAGGVEDVNPGEGARGNRCCRLSCSSLVNRTSMVSSRAFDVHWRIVPPVLNRQA